MKKLLVPMLFAAMALGVSTLQAKDAKENFTTNCKGCHGVEGKGDTRIGQKLGCKDYSDPKVQAAVKDDQMFKSIKEGLKKADGTVSMKPYGDKLTDDEIKALVAYIRTFAPKK
jgi:cytochrome c6